jgi:hypothetical protein
LAWYIAASALRIRVSISHTILRVDGDADAARDMQLGTADVVRLADQADQTTLDDLTDLLDVGDAVEDDDEFVAAHATHRVAAADATLQLAGHRPQEAVADVMAERIVHVLEAVEVDEQHGDPPLVTFCLLQRHAQALDAQRPVGQVGQHVVLREVADALLVGLALADVEPGGNVVGDLADSRHARH